MPRNGSGVFAVINPILIGRLRSSSAVNQNFTDAGDEMTNTLPLDGTVGMDSAGQFRSWAGNKTKPGLSFAVDTNLGIRLASLNEMRWCSGGVDRFYVDSAGKAWVLGAAAVSAGLSLGGVLTGSANDLVPIEALTGKGLARRTGTNLWSLDIGTTPLKFERDGGSTPLAIGIMGDIRVPFACTIVGATILGDATGSAVVDIWKAALASYPPLDANSITGSSPLTVSSHTAAVDTTLSGWTTALASGDVLRFNLDSVSTFKRLTIILDVKRFA